MQGFPWRLVTFDIDGTLTTIHGWELFARRTGRLDEYREANRRLHDHLTGEDEHLEELLDLAVGLDRTEVESVLASTPRIAGIPETIERFHALGAKVALLTHNPDYVCDWYRTRFGFDDAEGVEGHFLEADHVVASGPVRADKRGGLERLLHRLRTAAAQVAHVGDSWPDAQIFPRVGAGVAVNSSNPQVEQAADLALHLTDLRPLVPSLSALTPRKPVNDGAALR